MHYATILLSLPSFNTQTASQKSHLFPTDVRRGLSRRERPHVLVEITTVLVAHSLQVSLRRLLVETIVISTVMYMHSAPYAFAS